MLKSCCLRRLLSYLNNEGRRGCAFKNLVECVEVKSIRKGSYKILGTKGKHFRLAFAVVNHSERTVCNPLVAPELIPNNWRTSVVQRSAELQVY
jgi:hypothetical protein